MEKLPNGVNNQSLFSDYYLTNLVKDDDSSKKSLGEVKEAFNKIKETYEREKKFLKDGIKENETERRFIRPVLDTLGHIYSLTPNVHSPEGTRQPDFAFFSTEEDHEEAEKKLRDKNEYFTKAISVGDAKRWNRFLDKKIRESTDPFTNQNPSYQIDFYLRATDKKWGILTNGKHWRLYNRDTSYRLDVFYEVDLQTLLEAEDYEAFFYFYAFFRKEAFTEGFLERAYKESLEYTSRLGDELKENVYDALRLLADGFLHFPSNNLTENDLDLIRENTFVLIYRILFILYAEDRGLLPQDKHEYQSYSLRNLAKDIAEKIDRSVHLSPTAQGYWGKLQDLFRMINEGDDYTKVPPYNGGLFDNEKHPFLTTYKVGDSYFAKVIDQLTRAEASGRKGKGFVNYRDMEIRHIGSIYEGLLEHRLKIAPEDIAVVKDDKRKEIFIPKAGVGKRRTITTYNKGEVFLETDKGERKATGSYYTPDYIVKYIVSNTLGPLLEDKKKALSERTELLRERLKDPALGSAQKKAYKEELKNIESGTTYLEEILKTKVLDPAMGSGHFLVEATDFLARELVKTLGESTGEAEEDDIRWARREVVEKCIFGVDLNPLAVELAKLSLWLYTVARNRPLSFLDHHLRCGNSLIGAWIKDLGNLPIVTKKKTKTQQLQAAGQVTTFEHIFKQRINILLRNFELIEKLPSETVQQIKEKDRIYQEFRNIVRRFQNIADVWTSIYFGNEVPFEYYDKLQEKLSASEEEWKTLRNEHSFIKALDVANDKNFFHWELEFPEVFFEGHRRKDNPGFDVVIGNPPYIPFQERDPHSTLYFSYAYLSAFRTYDIYVLFIERSISLLSLRGYFGFINPNKFISSQYGQKLKTLIQEQTQVRTLIDFHDASVFKDAINYPCILLLKREIPNNVSSIRYLKIDQDNFKAFVHMQRFSELSSLPSFFIAKDWNQLSSDILSSYAKKTFIISLVEFCKNIYEGVRPGYEKAYLLTFEEANNLKIEKLLLRPAIKADRIDPYEINWSETGPDSMFIIFPYQWKGDNFVLLNLDDFPNGKKYLEGFKDKLYDNEAKGYPPLRYKYYHCPKQMAERNRIITPDISNKCEFAFDEEGKFVFPNTIYGLSLKDDLDISPYYLLALLNSSYIEAVIKSITPSVRGGFHRFKTEYLESLPIRCISFDTSDKERKKLFEKGKMSYERCMKKGDDKSVIEFVEHQLDAKPERGDVVHDLLAFLAEQMIDMNKEKQKEIKGFLLWLEGYLGTNIDKLINKTRIKKYFELSWEHLLGVLEQNRIRIDKVDVTSRGSQEKIKKEFEDSFSKLNPLLSRIRTTDNLIDQFVYMLYGLTDEEMKIMEDKT